jgi:hypothetical protein
MNQAEYQALATAWNEDLEALVKAFGEKHGVDVQMRTIMPPALIGMLSSLGAPTDGWAIDIRTVFAPKAETPPKQDDGGQENPPKADGPPLPPETAPNPNGSDEIKGGDDAGTAI